MAFLLQLGMTDQFPKSELFGLTSQMRRSAVSIAANIAEGSKRSSPKDFRQFIYIASGSGAELETHIVISKELSFGTQLNFYEVESLLEEVMKMLHSLALKLVPQN